MKNKISYFKTGTFFFSLFMILTLCLLCKVDTQAETTMKVKTNVVNFTKTKLSWKKHNVKKYIVYKISNGKRKKLKTLSGKSTSYTLKTSKNKYYTIVIEGVTYKNNKKVLKYYGETAFYSGLPTVGWDDYQSCDAPVTPKSIDLWPIVDYGIKPDGYIIYRKKVGTTTYKKIKTLKKLVRYTDKTVTPGESYDYRIRSYKKIKGKRYYSKYSSTARASAVWPYGRFTVAGEPEGESPVLIITSDVYNAPTVIDAYNLTSNGYLSKESPTKFYLFVGYSKDGRNWSNTGSLTLKAGESAYLKFSPIAADDPRLELLEDKGTSLYAYADASYDNITSDFYFHPYNQSASVCINSEFTH